VLRGDDDVISSHVLSDLAELCTSSGHYGARLSGRKYYSEAALPASGSPTNLFINSGELEGTQDELENLGSKIGRCCRDKSVCELTLPVIKKIVRLCCDRSLHPAFRSEFHTQKT